MKAEDVSCVVWVAAVCIDYAIAFSYLGLKRERERERGWVTCELIMCAVSMYKHAHQQSNIQNQSKIVLVWVGLLLLQRFVCSTPIPTSKYTTGVVGMAHT